MKKIIIIGTGGHAKSCCDVIELENKFEILGFISNEKYTDKNLKKYPILGPDTVLQKVRKNCENAFVAIGHIKDNLVRKKIFKKLQKLNFKTPNIISPEAYVSKSSKILDGTIIMHGAVVNAGSIVKKNCIINTNTTIEHDCVIENNCHLAPGATINGNTSLGENTFVGSNTVIKQSIKIGKNCFVNANKFIKLNLKDNTKKI